MSPSALRPLAIADLLAAAEPVHLAVDQPIRDLASTEPVRGTLTLTVDGPLLRVEGQAATTVTLQCDRCLRPFAHRLQAVAVENLALGVGPAALDEALDFDADGISEQLDPGGSFDPEHWIYEQLSLQLPLVNRCGQDCPGPDRWGSDDPVIDPRWAALRQLQP